MPAESGVGEVNREGTGRQASQAPAKHQRGQGAAAASGGREGAGTRGHATIDPLRLAPLEFAVVPEDKGNSYK